MGKSYNFSDSKCAKDVPHLAKLQAKVLPDQT